MEPDNYNFNSSEPSVGVPGESGADATLSDGACKVGRIILGDQYVNWSLPDDRLYTRFVWSEEVWQLPALIRRRVVQIHNSDVLVIAINPPNKWNKGMVRNWVADVIQQILGLNPNMFVYILTTLPRRDQFKMLNINFNRNIAAAIGQLNMRQVVYVPVHKVALARLVIPQDGVYDRLDVMVIRKFVLDKLGGLLESSQ